MLISVRIFYSPSNYLKIGPFSSRYKLYIIPVFAGIIDEIYDYQGRSNHFRTWVHPEILLFIFNGETEASLRIKSAGLTDFFSLRCCDFMIEILSKYFAVLNTVSVIQFHTEVQNQLIFYAATTTIAK